MGIFLIPSSKDQDIYHSQFQRARNIEVIKDELMTSLDCTAIPTLEYATIKWGTATHWHERLIVFYYSNDIYKQYGGAKLFRKDMTLKTQH